MSSLVKRILAFGSAILLALSLSVCSFAISSTVSLGFPFFTKLNLRRAYDSNYIYQGTVGSRPVSGIVSDVDGSSFATGSMFVFDFNLGGTSSVSVSVDSKTFSYTVPYGGQFLVSQDASYWQGSHVSGYYYDGIFTDHYVEEKTYNVTIPAGTETVILNNNTVPGGDYAITGFFEFPFGTIEAIDQLFTGDANAILIYGSENDRIAVDVSDLRFTLSASDRQVVQFMTVINVPESVSNISSGRVQLTLYTNSDVSAPLTRFGVNTGGFEYQDTVSGIGGLSAQLANWFSGLKSQLGGIAQLLRLQQDDAQQAASGADNVAVSEASSAVQEIHQFEQDLTTGISSGVSDIDFAIPSATGFVSALAAISFVMTSIFNGLGVYQFVITIPLILGIVLLLLGRGLQAVGRAQDIAVIADRRSERRGGG